MRNYVIINGTNSLTIKGLAINIMPPISKPTMRTLREEIDGRDGDIVTELGYQAYDKMLEIGLYGSYDINEIIAFFNQKGTIVFSDEADKYYNFQILEKIDYTSLQKFRTATITIHCQPFKYPLNETPIEIQNEYLTGEGTNLTLQPTKQAPMQLDLKGNTSQDGTPTPSSPVDINVVSGDNTIYISGKNLEQEIEQGGIGNQGQNYVNNAQIRSKYYNLVAPNTTYALSFNGELSGFNVAQYDKDKTFISFTYAYQTITTSATTKYIRLNKTGTTNDKVQIEKGSTATTYEPYKGNTYPIYLGVKDLFDKDNANIINTGISNKLISSSDANRLLYIFCQSNTTYTIQRRNDGDTNRFRVGSCSTVPTNGVSLSNAIENDNATSITITTGASDNYLAVMFYRTAETVLTMQQVLDSIKITKGTSLYVSSNPIELCKIGTYQDYIYKTDKWYLHKEIGKVVLDGSENWTIAGENNFQAGLYNQSINTTLDIAKNNSLCSHYSVFNQYVNVTNSFAISNDMIRLRNESGLTLVNWKNWLASNNVTLYYPLATPTNTEITDSTLISQLEETKESQNGTTNISQENNDMPFIISASALKEGSGEATITNEGTIYSKPTIELEGTGVVDIFKDGSQAFQVDLTEKNHISIDTQRMEATDLENGTLANRQVTGDYSKFEIDPGEVEVSISGELTKATITNYTRWL